MTAKHRKGKSNHKHEDDFFKNEVLESEVRTAANNYALHLVLFLIIVIGGVVGAWVLFQQHQTLTYLTDSLTGMQIKIVKLQSSHEEVRQSSSKQHLSESLETRLSALEESYSLTQKQVGIALATAEQLRMSDLPAQVLSLHTEINTRLAEMQQATVSVEQLNQLQTTLKGKSEELDGVRNQMDNLATMSSELSQKVKVLSGSLRETESKLEERAGQATTLSASLDGQAALVLGLKQQVDAYQAHFESSALEVATVRDLLQSEQSRGLQQTKVEEQITTLHQSLQDQTSAAHSLISGLQAQLDVIKEELTQLVEKTQPPAEPEEHTPPADPEGETEEEKAPLDEEEEAAVGTKGEEEAPLIDEEEEAKAPLEVEEISVAEESTSAEEVEMLKEDQKEQDESGALSDEEEVDTTEAAEEEQSTEEEVLEEQASEGVPPESTLEAKEVAGGTEEQQEESNNEQETLEEVQKKNNVGEDFLGGDENLTEESHREEETTEGVWEELTLEEKHEMEEDEVSEGDEEEQEETDIDFFKTLIEDEYDCRDTSTKTNRNFVTLTSQ